jgi:hypothetical protein
MRDYKVMRGFKGVRSLKRAKSREKRGSKLPALLNLVPMGPSGSEAGLPHTCPGRSG